MNDLNQHDLSETGTRRREQMLKVLKRSVVDHHRSKQRRRAGATLAVLLALISVAIWQIRLAEQYKNIASIPPTHTPNTSSPINPPPVFPATQENQPTANNATPRLLEFETVSNDEILQLLREVGRPSALAEINHEWIAIPLNPTRLKK